MQGIYETQARLLPYILECLEYETADHQPLFALKGGTALNYFVQAMPRLSVDIDLTYCPLDERDYALTSIKNGLLRLAQRLNSRLADIVCTHKHSTGGDKLYVKHHGATVRVEPNGVIRGTVFPTEMRPLCAEAQAFFGRNVMVRCLSEADLYGGKICAALDRQHPRDLFDILPLMQTGELAENTRKAFLVYALSHPRPLSELLDPHPQPLREVFQTEFVDMTRESIALAKLEEAREWIVTMIRAGLTPDERRFLLSCKAGEPDWSLAGLPAHVPQLPAVRWKLHNIAELRKYPQKYATAYAKLEACLALREPNKGFAWHG